MQAAILTRQETLVFKDIAKPMPQSSEVLVAVAYAGVCRTDRKCYHMGQRDLTLPRVLGHEVSGIVAAVGDEVTDYKIGERVQVHPGIGCGRCQHCIDGNDHLCQEMQILGFHIDGAFSQYLLVPSQGVARGIIQKVPAELPLKTAVLCEPLACAVNMAGRLDFQNQKVLIIGGGVLGLLMGKLAQIKGCSDVIILEKEAAKIKIAQKMGIKSLPHDIDTSKIKEIWPHGADIAIPCCPQNDGFRRSIELLTTRGKLGFFSGLTADDAVGRDTLNLLHYKELSLYGSYGCSLNNAQEALKLLTEYQEDFQLPTIYLALSELENVLKCWEVTESVCFVVEFKGE